MLKRAVLAIAVVGAAWAALAFQGAGQDPWWDPRNPNNQSAGVTYGTVAPGLPVDGLLRVEVLAGSQPDFMIYDQSTTAWMSLVPGSHTALTNTVLPRWDGPNNWFEDSVAFAAGTPAAGASGDIVSVIETVTAMDGGDTIQGLFVDLTNANHAGAGNVLTGIHIDNITADAQADESALFIGQGWDRDIEFEDPAVVVFLQAEYDFIVGTTAPGTQFELRDIDDFQTYMEISVPVLAMDNNDTETGFMIDITNADHAGANNVLNALVIDTIVGDAQALEIALRIEDGFDYDIYFTGTGNGIVMANGAVLTLMDEGGAAQLRLTDVPAAGTGADIVEIDFTPSAMDGAADIFRGLYVDVNGAANHTNGFIRGIDLDLATDDAQSTEGAVWTNATWDYALVVERQAAAPGENPPAGFVAFTVDDNADYSGAGGNDCALVARTSAGVTVSLAIIVLNGVCP